MSSAGRPPPPVSPLQTARLEQLGQIEGVAEDTWMDVIQKMDEVYSQLVRDEIALEEKNAQLERSQQFIFSLLSAMSDVLVACNESGSIEETNAALCELVGRREDELRATRVEALMARPEDAQRLRALLAQATPSRAGAVLEVELRDAQGRSVPVDLNCTPRLDSRGRCVGHVFVGRPMGEIKRAYHQLREAHEALKRTQQQLIHSEKMASLGRLVAGVAHELNNPISFVLGNVHALQRYTDRLRQYLDTLHARAAPDPELAGLRARLRIDAMLADLPSLMEGTLEGAQRTADIVRGLKRFSAVDREEHATVDLADVVERAIQWVRKGTAQSLDVRWQRPEGCLVHGNAGQLLQIAMNLIENAYDAASAVAGTQPVLTILMEREGERIVTRFRDNGPGIPEALLGRVFDPFFTTKPVGKGTGLGLSISYGLAERHGGRLTAGNVPGSGAQFVLDLPQVRPEGASPAAQ